MFDLSKWKYEVCNLRHNTSTLLFLSVISKISENNHLWSLFELTVPKAHPVLYLPFDFRHHPHGRWLHPDQVRETVRDPPRTNPSKGVRGG